jgi:hypothetical protein
MTIIKRPFEKKLYDKYDNPAKEALVKVLEDRGHRIVSVAETYYADVVSEYEGEIFHSEAEVKTAWKSDWPTTWEEIRIPERKGRLLQKYNSRVNFYVFKHDLTQCWLIKGKQMTPDTIKPAFGRYIVKGEKFFHIPYTEAELVTV